MPPRAYTISKLAEDADVSVHMIRDYELRGLITCCKRTLGGYRVYDKQALSRMRFVRFGMSVGITLDSIGTLFAAMDENNAREIRSIVREIENRLKEQLALSKQFCLLLNQVVHNELVPDCTPISK